MDASLVKAKFEKLAARAKIRPLVLHRWRPSAGPVVIDIGHDRRGEFFDIQADGQADIRVLDVQPQDRHLLLMVRRDKFLCGHDERHWFVAGVPDRPPVSSVVTAKEALKPPLVRWLERGQRGKRERRLRRKTETFVRQGEWFFIPAPGVNVDEKLVLRNEPIRRGWGKPHRCEFLYRTGGTTVYVCSRRPNGIIEADYRAMLQRTPEAAQWSWQLMRRDPIAYVRGKVAHPDHATIRLGDWHRVEMNTENRSRAMRQVAFLD